MISYKKNDYLAYVTHSAASGPDSHPKDHIDTVIVIYSCDILERDTVDLLHATGTSYRCQFSSCSFCEPLCSDSLHIPSHLDSIRIQPVHRQHTNAFSAFISFHASLTKSVDIFAVFWMWQTNDCARVAFLFNQRSLPIIHLVFCGQCYTTCPDS